MGQASQSHDAFTGHMDAIVISWNMASPSQEAGEAGHGWN